MKRMIQGAVVVIMAAVCAVAAQAASTPKLKCSSSATAAADLSAGSVRVVNCKLGSKKVQVQVGYSYKEYAADGRFCGSAVTGKGTAFKAQYLSAGKLTIQPTASVKVGRKVYRYVGAVNSVSATGTATLSCQTRPEKDPPPTQVCSYPFKNGNSCGEPLKGVAGPIPIWTSLPLFSNSVVSAPAYAKTPNGCWEVPDGQPVMWLGVIQQKAYWQCADGTKIYPSVYLYLASTPAGWVGPSCDNLGYMPNGGEFIRVNIPAGWGHLMAVNYGLTFTNPAGKKAEAAKGVPIYEYADLEISLPGNTDGCPDLTVQPTKP